MIININNNNNYDDNINNQNILKNNENKVKFLQFVFS